MPRGETKTRKPVEALAARVDGAMVAMTVEHEGGSYQVNLDISVDLVNDGLTLGLGWLKQILGTLSEHLEAAGEVALSRRLRALAQEV